MPSLASLYCTPQDVYDVAGIDAVQLREDDRNQATGQSVTVTADAAAGATSLSVAALQYPLLKGAVITFDQGGLASPVEVTLTAAAASGATTLAVSATSDAIPSGAIAIDDGVNVWLASLMLIGCQRATTQVTRYCWPRYDVSNLLANAKAASPGSVNQWATVIATRWIAQRLFRSAPQPVEEQYKETMEELKEVRAGQLSIENIGTRTSGWPFMSNVTLDDRSTFRKVRVEPWLSEPTPTQYVQSIDWDSIAAGIGAWW